MLRCGTPSTGRSGAAPDTGFSQGKSRNHEIVLVTLITEVFGLSVNAVAEIAVQVRTVMGRIVRIETVIPVCRGPGQRLGAAVARQAAVADHR